MGIRAYKAFYKKNYEISGHALDRFRERVDAEFQARPNEDLSNLLDERIVHSTDRFPIKDFTRKAKREGRIDKIVVRIDNADGAHCFALLEDKSVVTVLTAQMVDKNLTDGSWEHVAPKVNTPFAALAKIVIPTSDATVQRRTGVVEVIEQRGAQTIEREIAEIPAPVLYIHDGPIEPNLPQPPPPSAEQSIPIIEASSMTTTETTTPAASKPGIAELAAALELASKDVTTWSIAVQEAKRTLDEAMVKFVKIRDELNSAIMTLAGVPGLATAQIAATSKPAEKQKATRTQGDHLFKSPYTDEEKARFVELVRNGRTVWSVSKEFELTYSSLRKWCINAGVAVSAE